MQAPERSGCEEGFSNHKSIFHIVHDINMCIIWCISIQDNSKHFSVKRKKVYLLDRERSFLLGRCLKIKAKQIFTHHNTFDNFG